MTARFAPARLRDKGALAFLAAVFAVGIALLPGHASATEVNRADPQPANLEAGLAVDYYYHKMRHLDELVEYMGRKDPGEGEPLPNLDYVRGEGKKVLTTKYDKFVGADIRGFINFPEPGNWNLVVVSNDGIRLWIDGALIYEDPDVHADRESDMIPVRVDEAGWHELRVLYFQRKGSTALVLGWEPPGGDLEVVPPEAFGHAPD